MKFLIDLYKKATKGDSFRQVEKPEKYFDNVAIQNANPNTKITSGKLNSISKTSSITGTGTARGTSPAG